MIATSTSLRTEDSLFSRVCYPTVQVYQLGRSSVSDCRDFKSFIIISSAYPSGNCTICTLEQVVYWLNLNRPYQCFYWQAVKMNSVLPYVSRFFLFGIRLYALCESPKLIFLPLGMNMRLFPLEYESEVCLHHKSRDAHSVAPRRNPTARFETLMYKCCAQTPPRTPGCSI